MKVIFKIIPIALAFCQFALTADKNENINQGRSVTLSEQESKSPTKNMLDTLGHAMWPDSYVIAVDPSETLQIRNSFICVFPEEKNNQDLRKRFKALLHFKGDSLTILGHFNLNDLLDEHLEASQIFLMKVKSGSLKSLETLISEKPHLQFLRTLKHLHIQNLALFGPDIHFFGFFNHFIPSLPNLEEFTCGVPRLDFRESQPLGYLLTTLSGPKLKKVTFADPTQIITLEKKWCQTITDSHEQRKELEKSLTRSIDDKKN